MRTTFNRPFYPKYKPKKVTTLIRNTSFRRRLEPQPVVLMVPTLTYCPVLGAIYCLKQVIL